MRSEARVPPLVALDAPGEGAAAGNRNPKSVQPENAVRAGVRLGRASSAELTSQRSTFGRRIQSFARRVSQAATSLLLPFSSRLDWRAPSGARHASAGSLAARLDDIRQTVDLLLQRSDRLLQQRCVDLNDRDVLVRTPDGWLLVPKEDEALLAVMLEGGVLEPGTRRVLTSLLRAGDTMLDVGANIGLLCLPAARSVGAAGRVIAFEPVPRLARLLERSMHLNSVSEQVTIRQAACGERTGNAALQVGRILGHSSLHPLDSARETIDVPVVTVDEQISPGSRVAVVKIDAEGYELPVWRGMRRVLSENPDVCVIIEFGPSHLRRAGVSIAAWLDELRAGGFSIFEIDERSGVCSPLRSRGLEEVLSVNLLLLRRPARDYPALEFA